MNISRFKRLSQKQKQEIELEVSQRVSANWKRSRPGDFRKLTQLIDPTRIRITTENDVFEIQQSFQCAPEPRTGELFVEFCDDVVTILVVKI